MKRREYKLKTEQEAKDKLEAVELFYDQFTKDKMDTEYIEQTAVTTLEEMYQQRDNLTERIAKLQAEKDQLILDIVAAKAEAGKLKLKEK